MGGTWWPGALRALGVIYLCVVALRAQINSASVCWCSGWWAAGLAKPGRPIGPVHYAALRRGGTRTFDRGACHRVISIILDALWLPDPSLAIRCRRQSMARPVLGQVALESSTASGCFKLFLAWSI